MLFSGYAYGNESKLNSLKMKEDRIIKKVGIAYNDQN